MNGHPRPWHRNACAPHRPPRPTPPMVVTGPSSFGGPDADLRARTRRPRMVLPREFVQPGRRLIHRMMSTGTPDMLHSTGHTWMADATTPVLARDGDPRPHADRHPPITLGSGPHPDLSDARKKGAALACTRTRPGSGCRPGHRGPSGSAGRVGEGARWDEGPFAPTVRKGTKSLGLPI